jgi:uncharacterized membrane protein YfbV (UPF0208 family)
MGNQVAWTPVARISFFQISGSILRGTTFDQCACLYARLWWVGKRCESKKINSTKLWLFKFKNKIKNDQEE